MRSHETDPALGPEKPRAAQRHHEDDDGTALQALTAGKPEAADPSGVLNMQRAAGNASVSRLLDDQGPDGTSVKDVVGSGGGNPLDSTTRETMESAMGHDFSDVRVHTDSKASESAKAVQAHAYTVGSDIVFQQGQYTPGSDGGQKMLAHELTHVVQQKAGPVEGSPAPGGITVSDPSDRFEREAESNADAVMSGQRVAIAGGSDASVQRDGEEEELQASAVQREAAPEEEELQASAVQREEEEELQASAVQREAAPEEEEELQASAVQREEEEELQASAVQRDESPGGSLGLAGALDSRGR